MTLGKGALKKTKTNINHIVPFVNEHTLKMSAISYNPLAVIYSGAITTNDFIDFYNNWKTTITYAPFHLGYDLFDPPLKT